jgi:hypothetical protein
MLHQGGSAFPFQISGSSCAAAILAGDVIFLGAKLMTIAILPEQPISHRDLVSRWTDERADGHKPQCMALRFRWDSISADIESACL